MSDKISDFADQIETARWRVAGLERHVSETSALAHDLLPVAIEELHVAFEELRTAQDEMLHQQSELNSTRERVEAERRRYQELFEFAPDAYLVTTATGAIREANRAAAALLGVSQSGLVGAPLALFVASYARRAFRRDMGQLGQLSGPQRWEAPIQSQSGATFTAAITVVPIRDWSGMPSGLRWMLRDISEQKQTEERIRALNVELEQRVAERTAQLEAALAQKEAVLEQAQSDRTMAEQAVRDREAFMAVVAHELKNPLAAIVGYGQLLQKRVMAGDTLKSRDLRGLRTIVESARQLGSIVELLQDVAQIEGGKLTINSEPLDLNALVQEIASMLHTTLKNHPLDVRCAERPLIVEGDKLRLQQVVLNLIQNAIKYSPSESPIMVALELDGEQARLSVRDQGIGIPTEAREHIFERYFRADNADESSVGGTGIGLYVVREIVTLHGGRIEVDSTVGRGSTFTVWLPLATGAG